MSGLKSILLVEDSLRDAELTLAALEEHGLANDVVHVRDGAEALDYLYRRGLFSERTSSDPAVVFLDLKMPKVDGISLISFIREVNVTVPIIVFTGMGYDEEQMHAALRAGANGYVSKNLPVEQLYSVLSRVLATCQQRVRKQTLSRSEPALLGAA